jgi:hypothetical protein
MRVTFVAGDEKGGGWRAVESALLLAVLAAFCNLMGEFYGPGL